MTGTAIAQAISYLISPILTRIYTPEEMGDLGMYIRLVGFFSAFATLRYELALPLPKHDSHSYLLYRLALRTSYYFLAGISVIGFIYLASISFAWNQTIFALITIVSTFFLVFTNLGTNWAIRTKQFGKISNSRIINSSVANGLKLGFGYLNWGSIGLIFASLVGYIFSSITFIQEYFRTKQTHLASHSKRKTTVLIKEYRDFPLINLPHVLTDLGRDLLVALLIVLFFSKEIFGYYSHAYAMLRLPLILIGSSISQVLLHKCAEMRNDGESIYGIVFSTVRILFLLSIVPFTLIFFFGTPLFSVVFGEIWAESGKYAEIMSLWMIGSFITSTISAIPTILKKQKQFFYLGLASSSVHLFNFGILPLIIGTSGDAFHFILWATTITQLLLSIVMLVYILWIAKRG